MVGADEENKDGRGDQAVSVGAVCGHIVFPSFSLKKK